MTDPAAPTPPADQPDDGPALSAEDDAAIRELLDDNEALWPESGRLLLAAFDAARARADALALLCAQQRAALEQSAAFWRPIVADQEHLILSADTIRYVAQDYLAMLQPVLADPQPEAGARAGEEAEQ